MSYDIDSIYVAFKNLKQYRKTSVSKYHERFSFPYLMGTYFTYRKIDVKRVATIVNAISDYEKKYKNKFLEVGCGNCDFFQKINEFVNGILGYERNSVILYVLHKKIPESVKITDVTKIKDEELEKFNVIFVGWMDPGEDFRYKISKMTDVVITTLDQGLSLAAEYEEYGFEKIAKWTTPSWEDVNIEIMNRYYTEIDYEVIKGLSSLRGAHNFWYIYSKNPDKTKVIKTVLQRKLEEEKKDLHGYGFEKVLDILGFGYMQSIELYDARKIKLWDIEFY